MLTISQNVCIRQVDEAIFAMEFPALGISHASGPLGVIAQPVVVGGQEDSHPTVHEAHNPPTTDR